LEGKKEFMKNTIVAVMGLMLGLGSLQAAKLVTDSLPGLPGQSDAYWSERRQEQAEPQKGQGQFVNLREVAVKQSVTYQENESVNFYTGKPYNVELGAYVFKFRNYNPEMLRWTTVDPSGFPDGVNNYVYAAVPVTHLDPDGRVSVNGSTTANLETLPVNLYAATYTITAYQINFTYLNQSVAGTINVEKYSAYDRGGGYGGAELKLTVSNLAIGSSTVVHWIQDVNTTTPGATPNAQNAPQLSDGTYSYLDNGGGSSPWYDDNSTGAGPDWFYDDPNRPYIAANGKPVTWNGTLSLVGITGNDVEIYATLTWGFTIVE
jgi:RHS repeat-associated protein